MGPDRDEDSLKGEVERLSRENADLRGKYISATQYIRTKINQLLTVMGTMPLRPEELDDETLIELDPVGIISDSFVQILRHLHETNEKLMIANDEIQAIFDSAGMGILVIDKDMRILAYNMKLKEQFFMDQENVAGRTCYEVICGFDDPEPVCPFKRIFSTGERVHRMPWILNNSHYKVIGTPVVDNRGEISRVVMVYLDITDRILAEEVLASERERLAVTLRSIGDGVITTDIKGDVVLINRVAEKLTGWPQEEARGRPITEVFRILDGRTRLCCENPVEKALRKREAVDMADHTILMARDGTELIISDSVAPITDRKSEIIGTVLVFRDITEKKKMEEKLLKAEKIESLGILAGGIAHDFNNLLNAIMGNIDILAMSTRPGDKNHESVSRAEKAALRARDLTQQLLTFSKGGAPIKKTASINELIKDSADFALRGSPVRCDFCLSPDLWKAEVDEGQMSQVINNLVINAVQAMPGGGVLHISAENTVANKSSAPHLREGNYVKLTIRDEGVGIPREHLHRIFDPYFTTKKTGSGLGLATTYSIIRSHDGFIDVESGVGTGTTFYIYLPALRGESGGGGKTKEAGQAGRGSGKVLLMDDDELIRMTASDMLKRLGYTVEVAAEGGETVELYKTAKEAGEPFDAVIMDLTIPGGIGGREAIIKLLDIDPDVRGIVSSGYSSDSIMANYRQYGFAGVLAKPYRRKELGDVLKEVISKKERG